MAYTKVKPLMVASFPSSRLTGAFGAISGANLTGLSEIDTKDASNDPAVNTNPSTGVGHTWLNKTSGELFICTNATTDSNVWLNVGDGSGDVVPYTFDAIGDRGVWVDTGQGQTGAHMEYLAIPTLGNSTTFGNTTVVRNGPPGAASNGTRGIMGGGYQYSSGTYRNDIDYITISTPGNATDFGDLLTARSALGAAANVTRVIFSNGHGTSGHGDMRNNIDYITSATTGNATNFGTSTISATYVDGCADDTKATFWGGLGNPWVVYHNRIDYVTIATTGNATDFGDMLKGSGEIGVAGNGVRAIGFGEDQTVSNVIQYITLATTGNATDFGDMGDTSTACGATANDTRAVVARNGSHASRTTEYVTIATTGNAASFGTIGIYGNPALSGD